MMAKLDAHRKRMTAEIDAWVEGMESFAWKLQTSPQKLDFVSEHQDGPREEAAVETTATPATDHGIPKPVKKWAKECVV
jgi:hypothetical protein